MFLLACTSFNLFFTTQHCLSIVFPFIFVFSLVFSFVDRSKNLLCSSSNTVLVVLCYDVIGLVNFSCVVGDCFFYFLLKTCFLLDPCSHYLFLCHKGSPAAVWILLPAQCFGLCIFLGMSVHKCVYLVGFFVSITVRLFCSV